MSIHRMKTRHARQLRADRIELHTMYVALFLVLFVVVIPALVLL